MDGDYLFFNREHSEQYCKTETERGREGGRKQERGKREKEEGREQTRREGKEEGRKRRREFSSVQSLRRV